MRKALVSLLLALGLAAPAFAQNVATTVSLSTTTCPGAGCTTVGTLGQTQLRLSAFGTWSGTITVTGSVDQVNFGNAINIYPEGSTTAQTTTTANGIFLVPIPAQYNQIRVAFTSYASGSATVALLGSQLPLSLGVTPGGVTANAVGANGAIQVASGGSLAGVADVAAGQVLTSQGATSNPAYSATPTVSSATLSATTNQLVLGTTNTVTLSSTAPSASRTITVPDPGAASQLITFSSAPAALQAPPLTVYSTGSYTNATTTFSNVAGLSFAVSASTNYHAICRITWQGSANTTGPKYQFTGPSAPTAVAVGMNSIVTATSIIEASATAFSSAVANTGTVTTATNFTDTVDIGVVNGANAGTVQLQAAANGAGTLTVANGSYCTVQ